LGKAQARLAPATAPLPAKPLAATPPAGTTHPVHRNTGQADSRIDSRIASAAALALSHEPTFDEGTAQRIREAA